MTDRRDAERTEEVLRSVLEPDEEALQRVVRRALGAGRTGRQARAGRRGRPRPRRALVTLAGGLAGVAVMAAAVPLLLAPLGGSRDVARPQPAQPSGSPSTSASITYRDGVLIVHRLDGGASILDARAAPSAEPRGTTIILKRGDRP